MTLVDLDIYGRRSPNGGVTIHEQNNAISNAMVFFLTSKKGDFIWNPELGGLLHRLEFKLNTTDMREVEQEIISSLEQLFGPVAIIDEVLVIPNHENRRFEIQVVWSSRLNSEQNGVRFEVSATRGNPTNQKSKGVYDVDYVGENALNFVLLNLSLQKGISLEKTGDDKWVWGLYKFTSLQPSDPYFYQITAIIQRNQ